jgi:transcriptional regulator with XRE-family HTH domain
MKYKLDSEVKQRLIKNILFYREKMNLTQDFMAHNIGITQPLYNKIENRSREMTVNTLVKITEILGISMDSLFAEEDDNVTMNNIIALLKGKNEKDLEIVEDVMRTLVKALENSRESDIINM